MHSFSLIFTQKPFKLFTTKKEDKDAWIKAIKEAIGYSSLYDFYKVDVRTTFNF